MSDRGFFVVALESPKNAINIGSAVRALECYGGSFLVYTGRKYSPRVCSNTFKTDRHYPVMFTGNANLWNFIPFDCVPVAVELSPGARALPDYTHPERAFYIFGPEDGSVSHAVRERCRDVVYVPTFRCMNLGCTVNVVLYDRLAKRSQGQAARVSPAGQWSHGNRRLLEVVV